MKILWISNTIFPDPSEFLGIESPIYGGWMYGLAKRLSLSNKVRLAVATTYPGADLKKITLSEIDYFLLPCKNNRNYNSTLELFWEQVVTDFQPDVVHIHGTEYAHGLACMRKLPNLNYVVSIQGLVRVYSKYFFAGISWQEILLNITFRDVIKSETIFQLKQKFINQGKLEKEYLLNSQHTIGRTNWDFVHAKTMNPNINYHFCNESLRDRFYNAEKWNFENCEPYTIFLSQAGYPIKGLHQVIKSVAILKKDYPQLKIKIGGGNIINNKSLLDRIKRTGYGNYVLKLIKNNNLEENFTFLGSLSEEQMISEYQKANVFICPSSIENSPNSLGEAQLIGVPVVAAYVGGIPDMVENNKTGLLYRFEEIEMMAQCVRRIFTDSELVLELSKNSIIAASSRHHIQINLDKTISIYNTIMNIKY